MPERLAQNQELSTEITKQSIFDRFGIRTMKELDLDVYMSHGQPLMQSGEWDYDNPDLITNQIKELLEKLDPESLDEDDKFWMDNILWFWNHHAISSALYKKILIKPEVLQQKQWSTKIMQKILQNSYNF